MILKSEDSLIYWKFIMISSVISFLKKQVKQKKKLLLKSLFILLLWFSFMPQQTYFSVNEVYAAGTEKDNDEVQKQRETLSSLDTFMQAISDVAFALLWPLVALAGLAMDNTLIYGSFMWLDVSLWNIWQIVRSFANYTLWFLLLIWVLRYNLSWNDSIKLNNKSIKLPDLLKKVLIASVLIQASWFIMMVLVDLSTILTYSVWGIPYSILKDETFWSGDNARMFKMNVDLSLWDNTAEVENKWDTSSIIKYYWNVTWTDYIAPCDTVQVDFGGDWTQTFVLGREFDSIPDPSWKTTYQMMPWYCMYYGSLIAFNDIYVPKVLDDWTTESYNKTMESYREAIKNWSNNNAKKLVEAWILFPLTTWPLSYLSGWVPTSWPKVKIKVGENDLDVWNSAPDSKCGGVWIVSSKYDKTKGWSCQYEKTDLTVSNILQKAGSMTWPFTALYSSLSVYSNLQTWDKWLWQKFVITFVNLCFSALLVLPLLSLVVVLFARIWLLWIAIALSPFIFLIKVFDGAFQLPKSLEEYLNFDELIKLLLAPVFISLAVWISLIFMTVLKNSVWVWTDHPDAYLSETNTAEFKKNIADISWIEISWTDLNLLWFIKIKLDSTMLNISWLLTMFFWLWVTWFLLFFAIKQTKVWESIWNSLQQLWETFLKTTPIIPIGKNWLSLSWLSNAPTQILNEVQNRRNTADNNKLKALLDFNGSDYKKQWSAFVRNADVSFDEAFKINAGDYSNTSEMLKRMDSVYSTGSWWNKTTQLAWTYKSMITSATNRDDLDKIIKHLNDKWDNKIELDEVSRKIWDVDYKVKKWGDGKYVIEWGNLNNNSGDAE